MIRIIPSFIRTVFAGRSLHQGPVTDHFDGRRFYLPWDRTDRGFLDLLKWRFSGGSTPWPASMPELPPDFPPERVHGNSLRVSFIGHSTTLIQTAGVNILTDPVYADRAGPFGIFGPRRVRRPGVLLDKLPPIDAVLVTHNHYDHMDLPTLAALNERHQPRYMVPLGNRYAIRNAAPGADVTELDWWESTEAFGPTPVHPPFGTPTVHDGASPEAVGKSGSLRIHCVPAHHWSARGLFDRRDALWCSFVVETPCGNVYFCGDSGYGNGVVFRMARERFGTFRLSLLPIGAYEPRWFMSPAHMNPEEAVLAMRDLNAKQAAGLHHGVFKLTDEGIGQPLTELEAALSTHGISPENFPAPLPGESLIVP